MGLSLLWGLLLPRGLPLLLGRSLPLDPSLLPPGRLLPLDPSLL